jgi:hypothetical protein
VVVLIAVIVATGLSVMDSVNVAPVPQVVVVGVTIYVAVTAALVVLVNVPVIEATAEACVNPPVKPTPVGADHVYVVPAGTMPFTPFAGVTVNKVPLHPVPVMALTTAIGFIVTATVNGVPAPQPTILGVTV